MKILVTGAFGFVGSHLVKNLLERGHEIVAIAHDKKSVYGSMLSFLGLDRYVTIVYKDIVKDDLKDVILKYSIDFIFHLAGKTIVKEAFLNPKDTIETNIIGISNLLTSSLNTDIKGILYTSTDKVYGNGLNKKEDSELLGEGMYETSKIASEKIAMAFHKNYNAPIVITRACNIFGPFDFNKRIVPNTISMILENKPPVIYKEESYREYIYVDDVCEAYIKLMESIDRVKGEVFNVGSGIVLSQKDVVTSIIEIAREFGLSTKEPVLIDKNNYPEIKYQSLDSSKIFETIGWKAKTSFEEGIKKTLEAEISFRMARRGCK